MSPDIVRKLVKEAGYNVVRCSLDETKDNLYYQRDILLILGKEKP